MRIRTLALAAIAAAVSLAAVPAAQAEKVQTVVKGLDNPRGVAVATDGSVYVANAGRGGKKCEGKGDDRICIGTSGRIVHVSNGKARTVAKGIVSATGPGGVFGTGADGVSVDPSGNVFTVTTSGPQEQIRSLPAFARRQTGRLFEVDDGDLTGIARIDQVEWKRNIDGFKGDRNSNPYAVLALADRQIVVDAGANAVLQVRGGKISVLAVIPRNGKSQAVPTSIAQGPNGDFYVGELAEGAGRGKARVWRVPAAGGTPRVYASGFTAITGVAFGFDGSMFVTQFARNLRKEDLRGSVVRVAPSGSRTRLGFGKLLAPTGAAVDAAGHVFVSNYSVLPRKTPKKGPFRGAGGQLVQITP